ncbi:ABC transporter G family member 24-like [Dorcoceras hygrometricum]|uniref:ABC transporter G family member 24-like n=1 Tax=Dorcoceras hygrometricum TaxID=472368 RepID=A0A2Z7D3G0_9LAMI|nr:ABC transporter G family member 24-like [Dorcoceras hygrometricum]
MRRRRKLLGSSAMAFLFGACIFTLLPFSFLRCVQCQLDALSPPPLPNPGTFDLLTQVAHARLDNLTTELLSSKLVQEYSFCIEDPKADWDKAFNYSSDWNFFTACMLKVGDASRRLCTAAEVEIYFNNLLNGMNRARPNRNCNSTYWVAGCEPGWACMTDTEEQVDLRNSQEVRARVTDCQSCCEGFFCPSGITCMIPCPLGAHCPLGTLNKTTGICDPYSYRIPPGQPNHSCGGANIWADARTNREVFCSAGSYCPTNTLELPCSSGNYCPMGSTGEKRCFRLTTCDPKTESQNIHLYGVMLIGALSTLLLIIYNCSDQILTIRERRYRKSREAAVRNVREKTQARTRWKSAKDAAVKHVAELHAQISGRFSKRMPMPLNPEEINILNETETEMSDDLYPIMSTDGSRMPQQSNASSTGEKTESSLHIHTSDEKEDILGKFDIDSRNKDVKNKVSKGKDIHTRSQIFNYAYTQLEIEKAQQQQSKNLTFSGVLSMATNDEIKKRPLIEIAFTDLTVTLKGKNKKLLKSVTGKISPGRVTATMGPSGAGKTTFLSALAGKAVGCNVTGLILINEKAASVHSYRKIVGFVPQDDIVHGNLTVEENLWFSARCRLSADLSEPEKVLIVERVIDSLGLQAVRTSIVGTVEKRGISGGQRKRVNVGLELVMEPSLLFLDEPTSGLDSSSSQLLLRALRREALVGVNICMVVHQPSYALFQMFDDLILLAKGGLTVYHGPVREVEEYFAGLGICVPERVNPPDYFIDILEGLTKTSSSSGVNYEDLPVRWMLHNGYPIPPYMRTNSTGTSTFVMNNDQDHELHDSVMEEQSFVGEVWQHVKSHAAQRHDRIRHNFLQSTDLSNRKTPNIFLQYKYFLGRLSKQRLREAKTHAVDYLILLIAGACLGSLTSADDATFGFGAYTYTIIAVSLLCKIAALRSFSLDKLQYWRESASGISSFAHFMAKDTVDLFNVLMKPVVYLSMFYFFSNPKSSFADNYAVLLCLVYCVTGMAYALAIFLEPGPSQLCAVLLPVVLTLIATQLNGSKFVKTVGSFCYPKWALEAFVIANAERYYGVWLLTRCGALHRFGYNVNHWGLHLAVLILAGVGFRAMAFIGIVTFKKK